MVSDRNAETTIAGLCSCPTVFSAVPTGRYAGFSRETKPKLHQTLLLVQPIHSHHRVT